MSDDQDHNKTIMIRRTPAGAESPQPAPQPAAKKSEPAKEEASWLKSPLGILGIVIGAIAVTVVLVKLMGK